MSSYTRLSLEEKEKIYQLNKDSCNISVIAKVLKRHKSTISRELDRYKEYDLGYLPDKAHDQYRSKLSRRRCLFRKRSCVTIVIHHLTVDR